MTRKRRVAGTMIVIAAVVIAACLGPHLSSTAQEVTTAPMAHNFGMVNVGGTSAELVITISPTTGTVSSSETVSNYMGCTAFTVMGPLPQMVTQTCSGSGSATGDLVADSTCTITQAMFTATFKPMVAGAQNCKMKFTGTFGTQEVNLDGTGVAPMLAIDVSPKMVDFGDVKVNTQNVIAMAITNTGTATLAIDSVMITQPGTVYSFGSGSTGTHTLPPNVTELIDVICQPPVVGPHTGSFVVASNAATTPIVSVPLNCRGTNSDLQASPSPVNLDTRVAEPVDQEIDIVNNGGATANITAFAVVGHPELSLASAPPTPVNVGSGSSTTVFVRYTAETPQAKTALGKLRITHDGGTVDEVVLSAGARETSIAVNPDAIDFGPICAGAASTIAVAVFANAAGEFAIEDVTPPAPPFTFETQAPLPLDVLGAHGNDVAFTARAMPTAAGKLESQAVLVTDWPGMPARSIAMRAEGLPPGVSATPKQLDFGAVPANTTAPAQRVMITNCGSAPLAISGAHIEGAAGGEFAIVSPADPARTLAPTTSMEMLVVMTPRTAGAKLATMVVEYADGTATADLVGTALGPGDDDDDRRETYYRCSAGGAAGLAPVALAVIGLLARRRRRRSNHPS